jgi:hypothetical protein
MSPCKAIETLDRLVGQLQEHLDHVRKETQDAQEQWRQLGRIGGQREDHAAALLRSPWAALDRLQELAAQAGTQLETAIHDPWQEEGGELS